MSYRRTRRTCERMKTTPLGIVATFVTLTEIALGAVLTQTAGPVQLILTLFIVSFPVLAFFATLWSRPFVFYPPWAYGGETDAKSFVEAIQSSSALQGGKRKGKRERKSRLVAPLSQLIHRSVEVPPFPLHVGPNVSATIPAVEA